MWRYLVKYNARGDRVGDSHGRAVFSDSEIEAMRQLRESGMSYGEIARKFECTKGYVWKVCSYLARATTAAVITEVRDDS